MVSSNFMSVALTEAFAQQPDWSQVSKANLSRAQELVALIQGQVHLGRNQKNEAYYGWLIELDRMLLK